MPRPIEGDYAPFYKHYVSLTEGNDVVTVVRNSIAHLSDSLDTIPSSKAAYAYAPGKWTVNQVLQHMIDAERVFAYRAMSFARGEGQPLPGFDENAYAELATGEHSNINNLKKELLLIRQSSLLLFEGLQPIDIARKGTASNALITVNALGFIIVGHSLHHLKVLAERY